MEEKENQINYFVYALIFVVILIVATVAVTYAYYKINVDYDSTLVNVSSSLECVNLDLSDSGTSIGLSYNYPITDELASKSGSITPVTVTVTNNCSDAKNYTLTLSTIGLTSSLDNYIDDSKIRYKVLKNDADFKTPAYLSSLPELSTSNQAYTDLVTNGALTEKYEGYSVKKLYSIEDTISINGNTSNKYDIYLWVDYYEGDAAMYGTTLNPTHDKTFDGTTQGKKFSAAISLSLNP